MLKNICKNKRDHHHNNSPNNLLSLALLCTIAILLVLIIEFHGIPDAFGEIINVFSPGDEGSHEIIDEGGNPVTSRTCDQIHCDILEALLTSNSRPGVDTIVFSIGNIQLQSSNGLFIRDPVTIDGGGNTIIRGSGAELEIGFAIQVGHSTIRGLTINNFDSAGIVLGGAGGTHGIPEGVADGNLIQDNRMGIDGSKSAIWIIGSSNNNITNNVVSNEINAFNNTLDIQRVSSNNVIQNNYVGTDASGSSILRDGGTIRISSGSGSTITNNVVAAIQLSSSSNNVIQNNYVGTDASGSRALGNNGEIEILGSSQNQISQNVVAGGQAILGAIYLFDAFNNIIQGNYIGTDASGDTSLGIQSRAVHVDSSGGNTIKGNVISSAALHGIEIAGSASSDNKIQGNYIGTDASGTKAMGNGVNGILIYNAPRNTIGGTASADRNTISGNEANGIEIFGAHSSDNLVQGNYIGTTSDGVNKLGNIKAGILINGADKNTIGGTTGNTPNGHCTGACNLISGNNDNGVDASNGDGIKIVAQSGDGNTIQGNYIGTDISGTKALGNQAFGIELVSQSYRNTIGGTTPAERNIISGNGQSGIGTSEALNNIIKGNYIGTDVSGTTALGNKVDGIQLVHSAINTIGGTTPAERNIISGNTVGNGITVFGGSGGNVIKGNYIGTDVSGTKAVGNGDNGIVISTDSDAEIGGSIGATTNGANVISGNKGNGILTFETSGFIIQGNFIGTDSSGTKPLGNGADGIQVVNSTFLQIGDTIKGANNIIGDNGFAGVSLRGTSTENIFLWGNHIGISADNKTALGNLHDGVYIANASKIQVGGINIGEPNIIVANQGNGVTVTGAAAVGNPIRGNLIYANAKLSIDLGNDGLTTNDDTSTEEGSDSDSGPNDLLNAPVATTSFYNETSDETVITGHLVTNDPTSKVVDLYSMPVATNNNAQQQIDRINEVRYLSEVRPDIEGVFSQSIHGKLPTQVISATSTDKQRSTSEVGEDCEEADFRGNTDSDSDGICNEWETRGIDMRHNGHPTIVLHTNPLHKDIFIEMDYMANHRPSDSAIQNVVDAFAKAPLLSVKNPDGLPGITLHGPDLNGPPSKLIDDSEVLPEISAVDFDADKGVTNSFQNLKLRYFGTAEDRLFSDDDIIRAKRLIYHYGIWAKTVFDEGSFFGKGKTVGRGDLPGDDFVIGLGDPDWKTKIFNVYPGSDVRSQQYVFMHELGHNIGLHHGGTDDSLCKPNYISPMNYLYLIPIRKNIAIDWPLDYSRKALNTLNERHLNESLGVIESDPPGLYVIHSYRDPKNGVYAWDMSKSGGPIDWNHNGTLESDTRYVISYFPDFRCGFSEGFPFTMMKSNDDWNTLSNYLNFRPSKYYTPAAVINEADLPDEPALDQFLDMSLHNIDHIPVANNQNVTTAINNPITVNLTGRDPDSNGTLKFSIVTPPAHGVLGTLDPVNATLAKTLYTPNPSYTGSDNFTFMVESERVDSKGIPIASFSGVVNIRVIAANTPPIAKSGANQTVYENTTEVVLDGSQSYDEDGNITSYSWIQIAGPNVTLTGSNTVRPSFTAPSVTNDTTLTFKLTVTDNDGALSNNTATTTVLVKNVDVNIPPTAVDDNATTSENTPVNIDVLSNDNDPDSGDLLSIVNASSPSHGAAVIIENNGTITYTPNSGFSGTDTFVYLISDGKGGNDTATVTVNVNMANSAPVADNQNVSTNKNTAVNIVLTASDLDVDDQLTFIVMRQPQSGTLSGTAPTNLTYTPNQDFVGNDSFSFKANDGVADSNIATVTINVNSVNTPPTAVDDTATTIQGSSIIIPVLDNDTDPDGDALTVESISKSPSSGTATINQNDGTITYTAKSGFTGTDAFEYSIGDGNGGIDTATVMVTVNAINHAPVVSNIEITTDQDKSVSITLEATDSDQGDALTFSISDTSNGGQISNFDNKAGTLTYTPPAGFSGQDGFNYQATDTQGSESNTATVTITINRINKSPIANAGSDATVNEGTKGYSLDGTGSTDTDGQITKYIWTKREGGPRVSLDTTSHPGHAIFDVPSVTDDNTKLTFELVVEDNDGAQSQPDTVVISIKNLDAGGGSEPHGHGYWKNHGSQTAALLQAQKNAGTPIKLGSFELPTTFDIPSTKNDALGVLETSSGANAHNQLALQLLTAKLNIANGVAVCDTVTTAIENADTVLSNAGYKGPDTTKAPTGQAKTHVVQIKDILDRYNNFGCQ